MQKVWLNSLASSTRQMKGLCRSLRRGCGHGCQRTGHCHGSRGAKGGGARVEDWEGVKERDGTDEIGCFPLYEVAANTGRGLGNSGSSPGGN
jgi:hypothetical protein